MSIPISKLLCALKEMNLPVEYYGKSDAFINGFSSLKNIRSNSLIWIKDWEKYNLENIDAKLNLVVIANMPIGLDEIAGYNIIRCESPKAAFFGLLNHFFSQKTQPSIAASSVIETSAIGRNVGIGHNCFIGANVEIGDDVVIEHNVTISCKVKIGCNTIIHSGVVIGTDGFGYFDNEDGLHEKVEHFGGVSIGDNVEIGANTCIDRGTLDDTYIGNNVKIDNLCHIAHNVTIEENSMVIALSMLGGSSTLKKNVYIAPGVMVMNQVTIGERSLAGMGAVVIKDVQNNKVVIGVPAKELREN